jgi:hypothetical protein
LRLSKAMAYTTLELDAYMATQQATSYNGINVFQVCEADGRHPKYERTENQSLLTTNEYSIMSFKLLNHNIITCYEYRNVCTSSRIRLKDDIPSAEGAG